MDILGPSKDRRWILESGDSLSCCARFDLCLAWREYGRSAFRAFGLRNLPFLGCQRAKVIHQFPPFVPCEPKTERGHGLFALGDFPEERSIRLPPHPRTGQIRRSDVKFGGP